MSSIIFPNPLTHKFTEWISFGDYFYNTRDIIGFGGEMTVENLRSAYRKGIFPWSIEGLPLPWFCPEKRSILEFADLRASKSLQKERRKTDFTLTINRDFRAVIENCSRIERANEQGTWITKEFIEAFCRFHETGDAHSIEVWDAAGELVGGLYGVDAGGVFCGESMFYRKSNASKLALLFLIEHLQSRGAAWLDTQVITPHFAAFGAKEISRAAFLHKLKQTQAKNLKLF